MDITVGLYGENGRLEDCEELMENISQCSFLDDAPSTLVSTRENSPFVNVIEDATPTAHNYYRDEYYRLFESPNCFKTLKFEAIRGKLRSCRFRSLCWRLFLECLPDDKEQWLSKSRELRSKYEDLKVKYVTDPRESAQENTPTNNPLSQEEASPWNQFFQDNELRLTIKQDVVRTFPEISFFSEAHVQKSLCNILFYYAKENPCINYKQGMHEILAPVLFVVYSDQQTCLHAEELGLISDSQLDEFKTAEVKELLDPAFIEHDSYAMFKQIMETIEPWYSQDSLSFKNERIKFEPFSSSSEPSACSVLGVKLKMIFEQILKRHDHELFTYLQTLQITPQIFGIRWMRLLFGREFSMQDLLVVWDAIFSDGVHFALCDYIFVSMLMLIRRLLLTADYSHCMSYLMRYPNVPDVHYIIDKALHLKDPITYNEPNSYSPHVLPSPVTFLGDPLPLPRRDKVIFMPINQAKQSSFKKVHDVPVHVVSSKQRPQTLPLKPPPAQNGSFPSKMTHSLSKTRSLSAESPSLSEVTPNGREMKTMAGAAQLASDQKLEYCWKHLTSQIDVLQKCLARESNLKSEDEIFVALAELKKVRDVLKGSLRLAGELKEGVNGNSS